MDKETALYDLMLSELPHVGDKAAARILTLNGERQCGLATFFRLPAAVLREEYRLHAATVARRSVKKVLRAMNYSFLGLDLSRRIRRKEMTQWPQFSLNDVIRATAFR